MRHITPSLHLPTGEALKCALLDPALTPVCVSFAGIQHTTRGESFGLYTLLEAMPGDTIAQYSTVSLQTLATFGYRPVMV
jgi:hypothetical protein